MLCPCGSNQAFSTCCELIHNHHSLAKTAEQLMRARYTAFVIGNNEFIINTYHSTCRPSNEAAEIEAATQLAWCKLEIISTSYDSNSDTAFVEFKAWYIDEGDLQVLHENSRFLKESSLDKNDSELCWYYVDGQFIEENGVSKTINNTTTNTQKTARNANCPCGSGKKYKRCCA